MSLCLVTATHKALKSRPPCPTRSQGTSGVAHGRGTGHGGPVLGWLLPRARRVPARDHREGSGRSSRLGMPCMGSWRGLYPGCWEVPSAREVCSQAAGGRVPTSRPLAVQPRGTPHPRPLSPRLSDCPCFTRDDRCPIMAGRPLVAAPPRSLSSWPSLLTQTCAQAFALLCPPWNARHTHGFHFYSRRRPESFPSLPSYRPGHSPLLPDPALHQRPGRGTKDPPLRPNGPLPEQFLHVDPPPSQGQRKGTREPLVHGHPSLQGL